MAKKGKYNYIWIGLVVLFFGILFVPKIMERIQRGDVVEQDRISGPPVEYVLLGEQRRKVPSFALLNQDSLLITDADYRGKVFVAEFFFTTCPTICPVMTQNLLELQETFKNDPDFAIASFTINPRYDTPGVLKAYAERHGITDMDWHLLTGEQEEIYELANAGFNIFAAEQPEVPGGFEHSGLFALIDREGFIRSRKDSFGNPIIYYRGTITEEQGTNSSGETEQISILKEDIRKLLDQQ